MSSYFTSTTLIDSVKRRAHIPVSQSTFTDNDLLAFANEELMIGILPSMMKMHEEFFVYPVLVPLVANQTSYDIPDRAIGERLRNISYLDNNSNILEMARILPEDRSYYQNHSTTNYPRAFYVESNSIVLVPDVSATPTGSLRMDIFLRPNQLVTEDRVATIQSIDRTTGTISFDQVPSAFSVSATYDFLETKRGHKSRAIDKTPTSVNTITKTMAFNTSDIPSDLVVGDMVALAGECFIPQIPDELHAVLAQRVACRCLEAQKDLEGLQTANAKLQEMEINLGILVDNRTDGQPQKVNNLRGPLRMGKFRRRKSTY